MDEACRHLANLLTEFAPIYEQVMKVAPYKEQERLRKLVSEANDYVQTATRGKAGIVINSEKDKSFNVKDLKKQYGVV